MVKNEIKRILYLQLPKKAYVIPQESKARKIFLNNQHEVFILPWKDFLKKLWTNKII